jgi:hypothetical protein
MWLKNLFKKNKPEIDLEVHFKNMFKDAPKGEVGMVAPKFLFPSDGVYETRGGLGNKLISEITVKNGIITDMKNLL